jgi:hypothetical protein
VPSRPLVFASLTAFVRLACLAGLASPASAAPADFSVAFADLETSLAPWEAGRTRLMIYLQADSCARTANRSRRPTEGELALSLEVTAAGKAKQVKVTGSNAMMKRAATCLQRALRSKIHFLEQPEGFTWASKIRVGDLPDGLSVSLFRVDTDYVSDRSIFESVFVTQIERAACLASALEPGMSVAINADLEMAPGKPTVAKVELSTHAPDAVVTCLQPQLAAIVPPLTGVPSKVHVFFHLLQPAPEPQPGEELDNLRMTPTATVSPK